MIDADLAGLYAMPTKRLNEQVKRNARRFPADFCFQLSAALPYAFSEHGAIMAANVPSQSSRRIEPRIPGSMTL